MSGWKDRWGITQESGDPPSPWRVSLLVTAVLSLLFLAYVRVGYPDWNLASTTSIVLFLTGAVLFGLLVMLVLTSSNRGLDERRRRAMARYGIARLDDWMVLGQAMRTGEPPTGPRLDGPLLALVQRSRGQTSRARLFALLGVLGMITALVGAALDSNIAAMAREAFSATFFALLIVPIEQRSRRLIRLEKRLQSRTRRPEPPALDPTQRIPLQARREWTPLDPDRVRGAHDRGGTVPDDTTA